MKLKLLVAALSLAVSSGAIAQGDDRQKAIECNTKSMIFFTAAQGRDGRYSPEQAFKQSIYFMDPAAPSVTKEWVKNAVNLVYFDAGFSNIGASNLKMQIYQLCMNDWKPQYQPLK